MNNIIVYEVELYNGLINLIIYENATLKYFASRYKSYLILSPLD